MAFSFHIKDNLFKSSTWDGILETTTLGMDN
ncbi:MAG: hypothetical protein CM15mP42_10760 [Methanobacteriota archaeon]|nr:MAG: hypothetical protein CM15mP42_10760 [Euryarchaeota archaeon]